ncbi:GlsB/YeaQ/YmgE family stress response membrane protein [Bremerella sp. T1]|uniref:GlsB/YeaQ/YmgE family stress response membrane protein n=1 Tax=Bremerella sp. TYQ1 TaxID=3119568 RepID=UPI001CC9539B|nr:GlsB/YeaQ/YmgE family stress response membrane protein [Bremerella volcania]UBM35190.1 GlsB/YeaQ/YmgE family stress response membrane protein [Bremerella volcania]
MGILAWIIFGLIAGALAKLLFPGDDPGGCIVTIIIGIVGAMLGGFIATGMGYGTVTGFNLYSFMVAILGSMLVLAIYRFLVKGKAE